MNLETQNRPHLFKIMTTSSISFSKKRSFKTEQGDLLKFFLISVIW
jgi:hypothetical protein